MGVNTGAEHAIRALLITDADAGVGLVEGIACQDAAERNEGFFFELAADLVPAVFVVEVAAEISGNAWVEARVGGLRLIVKGRGHTGPLRIRVRHLGVFDWSTTRIGKKRNRKW